MHVGRPLILGILCCLCLISRAQMLESIEDNMLRLDFLTPGITYEKGISENSSFNLDAYLGFLFYASFNSSSNNHLNQNEDYFILYPGLALTLQYYFNRARRESRGRTLYNNSGMFFGPELILQGPDIANTNPDYVELKAAIAIGGVWGIQRTFKSNVNIALNIGLGYANAFDTKELSGFTTLSKLLFSYVIVPRKNKPKKPGIPEDFRY